MNNDYWSVLEAPMLIGVVSNTSVTTSLCFDGLVGLDPRILFRFIDPYARNVSRIDDCDVVIFVRHLFMSAYKAAFEHAKQRGKPIYLLVDDNFVMLAGEKQPNQIDNEIFKPYAQPIFRETLQGIDGILSASPALTEFYQSYHRTILPFSAVSDQLIWPGRTAPSGDLRVGFFGGGFRTEALRRQILPALADVAKRQPVTLFASAGVENLRDQIEASGICLEAVPLISNFREFTDKWRSFGLQIAVHPKGETANIKYKTANALLVSHYLGAVPIVADEPAYAGLDEENGVLKIEEGIAAAFAKAVSSRDILLTRLSAFCEIAFNPKANLRTIRKLNREMAL